MPISLLAGAVALVLIGPPDSTRVTVSSPAPHPSGPVVFAPVAYMPPVAPIAVDSLVVEKGLRQLSLFYRGELVRAYSIALGLTPTGDKERIGDNRTPEGLFHIDARNPQSRFHLSLHISYPDDIHRARAAALGVEPGGDIMLHGLPKGQEEAGRDHRKFDWTNGCIALTNEEIEEIWRAVPDGTPIEIKP